MITLDYIYFNSGVDHAGHKFGPDHPEMSRKLEEMNSVISEVIKGLPSDTVLFVFGDHGMTAAGDHGGDSQAELQVDQRVLNTRARSSINHHYLILFCRRVYLSTAPDSDW